MIIVETPELRAEIERASKENVAAGAWVAKTPLLDALRAAVDGPVPDPAPPDSNT